MKLDSRYAEMTAELQTVANRRNALRSTGPITHEGKATSSLNALKNGLTGRTVLLHHDDLAAYRQHIQEYEAEYKPEGLRERELVQSLADTQWRLQRIPRLELAMYAQGRAANQDYCDRHGEAASGLLELGTYLKHEQQLRNLHVQEGRLQRRFLKEREELRTLQAARLQTSVEAPQPAPAAVSAPHPAAPNGFESSTPSSRAGAGTGRDPAQPSEMRRRSSVSRKFQHGGTSADSGAGRESVVLRSSPKDKPRLS